MEILIGYARVSTDDQSLSLQYDALKRAGVSAERIYDDKRSGAKQRPGLTGALKALRPGDKLVVWRLDRLARSVRELEDIAAHVSDAGAELVVIQEQIDTSTASGKLFFHMMAALSEFERNLIRERTLAGLEAAKHRGRKPGRKPRLTEKQARQARTLLAAGDMGAREIAKSFGVAPTTLYRNLRFYGFEPPSKEHLSSEDA